MLAYLTEFSRATGFLLRQLGPANIMFIVVLRPGNSVMAHDISHLQHQLTVIPQTHCDPSRSK